MNSRQAQKITHRLSRDGLAGTNYKKNTMARALKKYAKYLGIKL